MKRNQNNVNLRTEQQWRHLGKWCCLSLIGALLWAGCSRQSGGSSTPDSASVQTKEVDPVGTYGLVTLDGKAVPCTLQHEGHTMTINSGKFIISADGNCSSTMWLAGREAPIEAKATYIREGPTLTMNWQGAGTTIGTISSNTFTMNNEGMTLVYRK